jgi:SAM-dependent methyltransferase
MIESAEGDDREGEPHGEGRSRANASSFPLGAAPGTQRPVPADYRAVHLTRTKALRYDRRLFGSDSYATWVWEMEKAYLHDLLMRYPAEARGRYVDFACGTGRVISFLEPLVGASTGVDISAEMLELARGKLEKSTLICGDPTVDPSLLPGRYSLITSFRFFLNAGAELRQQALHLWHEKLEDDGLLVFNMHNNRWSSRRTTNLFRMLVSRRKGLNQMSHPQVKAILEEHRFEVVEWFGCGFLTPTVYRRLPKRLARGIDRVLGSIRPLRYLALDLIFVCRKAGGGAGGSARLLAR